MFKLTILSLLFFNFLHGENFLVSNIHELNHAIKKSELSNENNLILLNKGIYELQNSLKFNSKNGFNLKIKSFDRLDKKDVVLSSNHQIINFVNSNNATLSFENITINGGDTTSNAGVVFSNQNLEFINCKINSGDILKRNLIFTVKNLKMVNSSIIYQ